MNAHSFSSRVCNSSIRPCAAVLLPALTWSSLAFCGEIHRAARAGDLENVKALLKVNPDLVFSKDDEGATALLLAVKFDHRDVCCFSIGQ